MKFKKYLLNFTCLFTSLIIIILFLEFSIRAYQSWRWKTPFFKSEGCAYNPELGWGGKKIFGDPKTKKLKIFFIGDSFTGGVQLTEENMYYNITVNSLNAEAFVYAGGAYGSLQEYIVLDKYFDEIKPDLVILQVCNNDFINNSWDLERKSFYFNEQMVRPYLIDGHVELRYPRDFAKFSKALCRSRFLFVLSNRIEILCSILAKNGLLHTIENEIGKKGLALEDFRAAISITDEIIVRMKKRTGKARLIAFSVDDTEPYFQQFKNIFKQNNIEFFTDVPGLIRKKEKQGINLRIRDGHWNEAGQRICAEALTKSLKQLNLRKVSY